ncbi:MAG: hypothetical protein IPJ19_04690 [Planctomycetes bacterium]|nr:hypothetical protein [Planctomycetota bacterium]
MSTEIPEQILAWFDRILDKLQEHPSYAQKIRDSHTRRERWILNYHSHGEGQPFCVSICTREEKLAVFGLPAPLEELAHIRAIGKNAEDCVPLCHAFGARLLARYPGAPEPLPFFQGEPLGSQPPH